MALFLNLLYSEKLLLATTIENSVSFPCGFTLLNDLQCCLDSQLFFLLDLVPWTFSGTCLRHCSCNLFLINSHISSVFLEFNSESQSI